MECRGWISKSHSLKDEAEIYILLLLFEDINPFTSTKTSEVISHHWLKFSSLKKKKVLVAEKEPKEHVKGDVLQLDRLHLCHRALLAQIWTFLRILKILCASCWPVLWILFPHRRPTVRLTSRMLSSCWCPYWRSPTSRGELNPRSSEQLTSPLPSIAAMMLGICHSRELTRL